MCDINCKHTKVKMEVTGRDRVHFFRRPILPNTMPLPYIRYAREISQDVADIKRRDRLKEDGHGATTAAHGILKTGSIHPPGRERTTVLNSTTGTRMTKDGMTLSVTKLSTLFVPELFVQVSQSMCI